MKIETERKYYCSDSELLVKIAEDLNFKKSSFQKEVDEYFTDIDSEFIKNRTCLRIRKTNDKLMEITYKGKSNELSGNYCKLENNINSKIEEYDNYIKLFSSLGYYSYVEVDKERIVYELNTKKYKYSIMLDKIKDVGNFVEFEILSEQENSKKSELKKELDSFVKKFDDLKLEEASLPYRDIVANHIYNSMISEKTKNKFCINIDNELAIYEKQFFNQYKDKISKIYNKDIEWEQYKNYEIIDSKISKLVEEYIDNLIFVDNSLFVTINLLSKINYEKCFFTNINKTFFTIFFKKVNLESNDIVFLNNDETISYIEKNKDSVIIFDKTFKEINSIILIMLNI